MTRILYLPIETIAREFDAKCLLAHRALQRKYEIIIGKRSSVFRQLALSRKTGIYLDKSMPRDAADFGILKKAGVLPVVLDEEGLFFTRDKDIKFRIFPEALPHIGKLFTWGNKQKELTLEFANEHIAPEQIEITGNPRFDLLRPEYNNLFKKRAGKIKKDHGRFVLINSNFTLGNLHPEYGDPTEYLRKMARIKYKEDEIYYQNMYLYKKSLMEQYVQLIEKIVPLFPKIKFIVRPHPSERHETWKEELKNIPNAECIFEGSANEWIYASECLIHSGCTTGVEAWIMRKPVIRYNPQNSSVFESEFPNRFGYYASSPDEVANYIEKLMEGKLADTFESQLVLATDYIESLDGSLAVDKILDQIDKLDLSKELDFSYKIKLSKQKFLELTKGMIEENLSFFNKVSGNCNKNDYIVRKIQKDIFLLRLNPDFPSKYVQKREKIRISSIQNPAPQVGTP